jgi:hypothetical protein
LYRSRRRLRRFLQPPAGEVAVLDEVADAAQLHERNAVDGGDVRVRGALHALADGREAVRERLAAREGAGAARDGDERARDGRHPRALKGAPRAGEELGVHGELVEEPLALALGQR